VQRSAKRARVLARLARRLFVAKPMPDLAEPVRAPRASGKTISIALVP
jgi:hypothetical protein